MRWLARAAGRLRREEGFVALELALGLGVLVLPLTVMVLTFPTWVERQSLARSASQEAARTVVLSDSWDAGVSQATALVRQMADNAGLSPAEIEVDFSGALARGSSVTATVSVTVPGANLPFIGTVGAWSVSSSDTEQVDLYRSFP
jgi:hypothetical protein